MNGLKWFLSGVIVVGILWFLFLKPKNNIENKQVATSVVNVVSNIPAIQEQTNTVAIQEQTRLKNEQLEKERIEKEQIEKERLAEIEKQKEIIRQEAIAKEAKDKAEQKYIASLAIKGLTNNNIEVTVENRTILVSRVGFDISKSSIVLYHKSGIAKIPYTENIEQVFLNINSNITKYISTTPPPKIDLSNSNAPVNNPVVTANQPANKKGTCPNCGGRGEIKADCTNPECGKRYSFSGQCFSFRESDSNVAGKKRYYGYSSTKNKSYQAAKGIVYNLSSNNDFKKCWYCGGLCVKKSFYLIYGGEFKGWICKDNNCGTVFMSTIPFRYNCKSCNGSGNVLKQCTPCNGTGFIAN